MAEDNRLARRLGLTAVVLTGLGVIIGSGIYVILGIAAGPAGNSVWLSFLIAATGASFTALSYARLARSNPQNAPEFHYVSGAFGRTPGFLAGWLILVAQIVSSATVALGFAGYFNALTGLPALPAAIVLIIVCLAIIFAGIGQSAAVASLLTVIEIVGLLVIIGIGATRFGTVDYFEMPSGISGVLTGASLVFFAYLGFEGMANLAGEMKSPRKDMPRAIVLALLVSAVLYTITAICAVSALGWEALSQSSAPFVDIAREVLGSKAGFALALMSLASTANTVLVLLLAGSRIAHAMAAAGGLPGVLSATTIKSKAPWAAILAVGFVALIFVLFSDTRQVAEYTNFTTLLAFIGVNAGAIRLLERGHRTNSWKNAVLNRIFPLLGIAFAVWLAVNAGKRAAIFGAVVIAAGLFAYAVTSRWRHRGTAGNPA